MKKNRMPFTLYSFLFFKGNDILNKLTSLKPRELRVGMERLNGEKAYAVYSSFFCRRRGQ